MATEKQSIEVETRNFPRKRVSVEMPRAPAGNAANVIKRFPTDAVSVIQIRI